MKLLTANRLTDGVAVWWSDETGWVERIDAATPVRDAEGEARLEAIGRAGIAENRVIDVNLIDVGADGEGFRPLRLRERIRAAGPTNRLDLGKQAEPAPAEAGASGDAHVSI